MDEASVKKEFGLRVRTIRTKAGLSQEELANSSGLDRTYIGGVERGERNISLINIIRISNALKIEPTELFSHE